MGQVRGDFVFRPYGRRYLWKALKSAAKKAGLPDSTRLHDLRHSFASQLVQQGVALSVVARLLGHANMSQTMQYAGHAPAALGVQAIAALAEVRGQNGSSSKAEAR